MSSFPSTPSVPSAQQRRREKHENARHSSSRSSILWFGLVPILILVPWWAIRAHYHLPTPKIALYDDFGNPQISESRILQHVSELTDPYKVGFRTVGTKEHALGDAWAVKEVKALSQLCEDVKLEALNEGRTVDLECEWDRQQGSGTHKFDIMNRVIYKSYQNLTNILFRMSSSQPGAKSLSILLNAHLDSTLPTPGAADDALAVAICIDIARVLIEKAGRGDWYAGWSIIFLINNAEESFQDASHLFSTQHPWAESVRTVVNMEAAGSKGPELLFQATSEEMVDVYQGVPHPYGTVLANDIFASGIMMSDTDFRQFDQYLSVPGIDLAVVGHSYYYHTTKDTVENIEPGVAQHFAENVLEIVKRTTFRERYSNGTFAPTSLLQRVQKFSEKPELLNKAAASSPSSSPLASSSSPFASSDKGGQQHSRRPDVVFYSFFGQVVIVYSGWTARVGYSVWGLLCIAIVLIGQSKNAKAKKTNAIIVSEKSSSGTNGPTNGHSAIHNADPNIASLSSFNLLLRSAAHLLVALLISIVYANVVAFFMRSVLGRQLSWFAGEWRPVGLYVWPSLLGLLSTPPNFLIPKTTPAKDVERSLVHASLLLHAFLAVVIQLLGVGSAVVFFLVALGLGVGVIGGLVSDFMNGRLGANERISSLVYLIGSILPLADGMQLGTGTLDVFVPLTGRMPPFVPAEHIIATPIPVLTFLTLPLIIPLACRLPTRLASSDTSLVSITRKHVVWAVRLTIVGAVAWYAFLSGWGAWPFDSEHPKRIFVSFTDDVSHGTRGIHLAAMDGASGFPKLVNGVADVAARASLDGQDRSGVVAKKAKKVDWNQWNTDWNPFYPLGELFDHYSLTTLPALPSKVASWQDSSNLGVVVLQDEINESAGTRSLRLEMRHKDIIWTVLAFDAHVLSWSIDDNPPDEYTRHHIKEASFYGTHTWELNMVVKLNPDRSTLKDTTVLNFDANGDPVQEDVENGIEMSLSGMVEKGMWPGKKWAWGAAKERAAAVGATKADHADLEGYSMVMPLFEELSSWFEKEYKGSTDVFMMHNVVKRVVV